MPDPDVNLHTRPIKLNERRTTLKDGRYMVFFTFGDEATTTDTPHTQRLREAEEDDIEHV
jgi:hypothetical protein